MSTFEVKLERIRAIEPIEGANTVESVVIGDYRSVVKKGSFVPGDVVLYIPEQTIVPIQYIRAMGLEGKLAGANRDRVKAIRVCQTLSQGLVYATARNSDGTYNIDFPADADHPHLIFCVSEGENLADRMGFTKWQPPIPASLGGEVFNAGTSVTYPYDIEDVKKYNTILRPGELVAFTEKIHGTFTGVCALPQTFAPNDEYIDGRYVVFSKGLGSDGLAFRDNEHNRTRNLYVRVLLQTNTLAKFGEIADYYNKPVFFFGETFGAGVQDLTYGNTPPQYQLFDIAIGYRNEAEFLGHDAMHSLADMYGIATTPVIYRGPFSTEVLQEHTAGKSTVEQAETQMREGVVIHLVEERRDYKLPNGGRVILKSVSDEYRARKNKNATEYQ